MAIDIPARDDIHKDFVDTYSTAFPEKNTSRGSDPWRLGRVVSGTAWSILSKLLFALQEFFPDTTTTLADRWGKIIGLPRRGPAPSQGAQALAVTGTPASPVPVDSELSHADGTLYKVTSPAAVLDGGGNATVDIAAISKGLQTNKRSGDVLTFTVPPPGVNAQATLVKDLQGGDDNESTERYRPRIVAQMSDPPEGGAIKDYIDWALQVPGVQDVYVWQHRRGKGTVDIAVLGPGTGTGRIITDLAPVQSYIDARRPAGMKSFKVLTVTTANQSVTIEIEIDEAAGFKWDWLDDGTGYTITAANAGTKQITVPTIPATVVEDVRITVNGEEARVVAVDVGLHVLTLDTWFSFDPTTKLVRASGDLVVPVRNAILARFDSLGPARNEKAATSWDDSIRVAKLLASACDVEGVVDADVTTPPANVSPVDPLPTVSTQITLLVPDVVMVVRKPA